MATYAQRDAVLESLGYFTYADYLTSELWHGIRRRVFERDHYLCKLCDRGGYVIHHLSYAHTVLQGQDDSLLVTLCHGCHKRVEFCKRGVKRTLGNAVATYHKLLARKEQTPRGSSSLEGRKCEVCGNDRSKKLTPCKYCKNRTHEVTTVRPPVVVTKRYAPSGKGYHTYTCGTCGASLPRSKTIRYSAKVYRTPKVQPCTRCKNGLLGPDD